MEYNDYYLHTNYYLNLIRSRLSKLKLRIKGLFRNDLDYLNDYSDDLCGPIISNSLESLIGYLDDFDLMNLSVVEDDSEYIYTYVITPLANDNIISIVSARVGYIEPNVKLSKSVPPNQHMYIDFGCSYQSSKYSKLAGGINYYIRAYIIILALKRFNIKIIYGHVSGDIGGDPNILRQYHIKRGCQFYKKTDIYYCNVETFLDTFFKLQFPNYNKLKE